MAEEAPEVPASTSKEGVFALEDIDWMTKEQFQAHLDPHQESKSYNTIKAGEEITDGMIHGESGRHLAEVILEGSPEKVEVRGKKAEDKKVQADARKNRWTVVKDMNKAGQVAILGKLGYDGEVPRYENGRCDLIVALEFKDPIPEPEEEDN